MTASLETVAPESGQPLAEVAESSERAGPRNRWRQAAPSAWLAAIPLVAAAIWTVSLIGADPREMGDLGLVSLLPIGAVGALVLLSASFLLGLRRRAPEWVLGTHLVTYLLLIHGTPAVLYGTLRYEWAFKHVGIVDYILRTGGVDPDLVVGQVYQNWPGFFAGSALLTALAGQPDALALAVWAPVLFSLITLVVLRYVFRGLTLNTTLIWLGLWFFFIINWVGQEYFSPQAMVYPLYLACVGLLIRRRVTRPGLAVFVAAAAVVAASHQITPLMLITAVTAMVVLRRTPGWHLPLLTVLVTAAWAFTAARSYTLPNLMELVVNFGQPLQNASETLDKGSMRTGAQQLVVWAGRGVVAVSSAMALLGAWRSWRAQGLGITAILLMVVPGMLVLTTGFGGEVLFRAFMFAAPFVAFLAAAACLPRDGRSFPLRSLVVTTVLTAILLPGFLLSYYGKEREHHFTPAEVEAARWVAVNAAPNSLLIEGSRSYPAQFLNYENLTYVPIDREDEETWRPLLDDPPEVLGRWLDNSRYAETFVFLTRSQGLSVDANQSLPPGSIAAISAELKSSPEFRVAFENEDATVFTLAGRGN